MNEMRSPSPDPMLSGLRRAEVLAPESEDGAWVRFHDARTEEVVRAELAVLHYTAVAGDWVLVSEVGADRFVVGVLGTARRRYRNAESDVLELTARQQIVLSAPSIELNATTVIERSECSHRQVNEAHLSCQRSRTLVEGDYEVVAGRASIVAEQDTHIDGRRVLLG